MIQKVKKYIEKYNMLESGDTVVLGVSGGADSVCLLCILGEYAKEYDLHLVVVHINHLIREEAVDEEEYVKALCEKMEVPFFLFKRDVVKIAETEKISTEEAGRKVRYKAFEQVLKEQAKGKGKIAVAHNQGDCGETLLFNLFRGTGLNGMVGIAPVRDKIIRPLLCVTREEIEEYLTERTITWCIDCTNAETIYTRNKIRNIILPYVETEICQGTTRHLAQVAEQMLETKEFIKIETRKAIQQIVQYIEDGVSISVGQFIKITPFLQKQIILQIMKELTGGRDITALHIENIYGLFEKKGTKQIDLPYSYVAIKEYGVVIIKKKKEKKYCPIEEILEIPGEIMIPNVGKLIVRVFSSKNIIDIPENNYTKWFDYDKIIHCLKVRNRQTGDFLTINDSFQKKTVKDYMIQEKIPKQSRELLPLIADGKHIIWIPNYRTSVYYKVTTDTINILEIQIENDDN